MVDDEGAGDGDAGDWIARAVVVGGGTMGAGIAWVCAVAGIQVDLIEADDERRTALSEVLADRAAKQQARQPDGPTSAELTARITVIPEMGEHLMGADLAVEAVPERVELKRAVLAQLAALSPRLLGSNTSSIGIGELAATLPEPVDLVGLHFFNPVHVMELLEIVVQPTTSARAIADAQSVARRLGKEAILVADQPGFATSRLGVALGLEAMRMLADGVASAADIDRAMELGYRHPMGPLRLTDLVGLDVRLDIARSLQQAYGDRFAPPQILIDLVAAGHLGRKTGRGFHVWDT